jgi:hypothetical protein
MALKPTVTKPLTASEILLAERMRIAAILESPEGLRRPTTARKLALNGGMSDEQAIDLLRSMPTESPFLDAMHGEAIGISSATAGAIGAGSDPKQARIAEIKAAGRAYSASRGYTLNVKAN